MPILRRHGVRGRLAADARDARSDACAHACAHGRSDPCARDPSPDLCAHTCANGRPDACADAVTDASTDPGSDPGSNPGADHRSTDPGADHGGADFSSDSGPKHLGRAFLLQVVGGLRGHVRQLLRKLVGRGGRLVCSDGGELQDLQWSLVLRRQPQPHLGANHSPDIGADACTNAIADQCTIADASPHAFGAKPGGLLLGEGNLHHRLLGLLQAQLLVARKGRRRQKRAELRRERQHPDRRQRRIRLRRRHRILVRQQQAVRGELDFEHGFCCRRH
mmetsp:Transcript_60384/g.158244  ORF Transcript_60384/g.158244 Transcript_60384/m.158244 type:complete len:277 (+) Transcript_60384:787-1617(+)